MVFDPMQVYIFKILFMNLALAPPRCGASQKKKIQGKERNLLRLACPAAASNLEEHPPGLRSSPGLPPYLSSVAW